MPATWRRALTAPAPLYKIRGLLRHGVEHLTESQQASAAASTPATSWLFGSDLSMDLLVSSESAC